MAFNVYIDESGDAGIAKLRTKTEAGATPYFVMGAVVCQPTAEVHARNAIQDFKSEIGKTSWKHATDLSHPQRVYLGRNLGRLPVRYFALISRKETLASYRTEISNSAHKFYNKCAQLLLENICRYLSPHLSSSEEMRVVFEDRNHDFDAMRRYLGKIKENPHHPNSRFLRHLNPFSIVNKAKGEDAMLEIADFVAHAVFQCVNRSDANFRIPEPRYFSEISSRFAGDGNGRIINTGMKCIHSIDDLLLDPDIHRLFETTFSKPPKDGTQSG